MTKTGEAFGNEFMNIAVATPEFGPRKLYADLDRAAGQDNGGLVP